MRVVVVEAVAEHRVGERRVRRGQRGVEADRGRIACPELGHRRAALTGHAQPMRGEPAAQHVEHVELRRMDDLVRDLLERQ